MIGKPISLVEVICKNIVIFPQTFVDIFCNVQTDDVQIGQQLLLFSTLRPSGIHSVVPLATASSFPATHITQCFLSAVCLPYLCHVFKHLFDGVRQDALRHTPHDGMSFECNPIVIKLNGGNAQHSGILRNFRQIVRAYFHNIQFTRILFQYLLNHRNRQPTRTAPVGVGVSQEKRS